MVRYWVILLGWVFFVVFSGGGRFCLVASFGRSKIL